MAARRARFIDRLFGAPPAGVPRARFVVGLIRGKNTSAEFGLASCNRTQIVEKPLLAASPRSGRPCWLALAIAALNVFGSATRMGYTQDAFAARL